MKMQKNRIQILIFLYSFSLFLNCSTGDPNPLVSNSIGKPSTFSWIKSAPGSDNSHNNSSQNLTSKDSEKINQVEYGANISVINLQNSLPLPNAIRGDRSASDDAPETQTEETSDTEDKDKGEDEETTEKAESGNSDGNGTPEENTSSEKGDKDEKSDNEGDADEKPNEDKSKEENNEVKDEPNEENKEDKPNDENQEENKEQSDTTDNTDGNSEANNGDNEGLDTTTEPSDDTAPMDTETEEQKKLDISHQMAKGLCRALGKSSERRSYLWAPIDQYAPALGKGFPLMRPMFTPECLKWTLRPCKGASRYPLLSPCTYWAPMPLRTPECFQKPKSLDVYIKGRPKKYNESNCPCVWPCSPFFDPIQRCRTDKKIDLGTWFDKFDRQGNSNSSFQIPHYKALQLCHGMKSFMNQITPVQIKAIPIRIQSISGASPDGKNKCKAWRYTSCNAARRSRSPDPESSKLKKKGRGMGRKSRGRLMGSDEIGNPVAESSSEELIFGGSSSEEESSEKKDDSSEKKDDSSETKDDSSEKKDDSSEKKDDEESSEELIFGGSSSESQEENTPKEGESSPEKKGRDYGNDQPLENDSDPEDLTQKESIEETNSETMTEGSGSPDESFNDDEKSKFAFIEETAPEEIATESSNDEEVTEEAIQQTSNDEVADENESRKAFIEEENQEEGTEEVANETSNDEVIEENGSKKAFIEEENADDDGEIQGRAFAKSYTRRSRFISDSTNATNSGNNLESALQKGTEKVSNSSQKPQHPATNTVPGSTTTVSSLSGATTISALKSRRKREASEEEATSTTVKADEEETSTTETTTESDTESVRSSSKAPPVIVPDPTMPTEMCGVWIQVEDDECKPESKSEITEADDTPREQILKSVPFGAEAGLKQKGQELLTKVSSCPGGFPCFLGQEKRVKRDTRRIEDENDQPKGKPSKTKHKHFNSHKVKSKVSASKTKRYRFGRSVSDGIMKLTEMTKIEKTPECRCDWPCLPFFDPINKCYNDVGDLLVDENGKPVMLPRQLNRNQKQLVQCLSYLEEDDIDCNIKP